MLKAVSLAEVTTKRWQHLPMRPSKACRFTSSRLYDSWKKRLKWLEVVETCWTLLASNLLPATPEGQQQVSLRRREWFCYLQTEPCYMLIIPALVQNEADVNTLFCLISGTFCIFNCQLKWRFNIRFTNKIQPIWLYRHILRTNLSPISTLRTK